MWFFEMFTDLDSRARIFAILMSAGLAFWGLRYTQGRTDERERVAHLRAKIEEAVNLTLNTNALFGSLCVDVERYSEGDEVLGSDLYLSRLDEFIAISSKLEALLNLYIPSVKLYKYKKSNKDYNSCTAALTHAVSDIYKHTANGDKGVATLSFSMISGEFKRVKTELIAVAKDL